MGRQTFPDACEPFYKSLHPSQDVSAFTGKIKVRGRGGSQVEGNGRIFLRWLPNPSLRFEVEQPGVFTIVDLDKVIVDAAGATLTGLRAETLSGSSNMVPAMTSVAGVILDDFSLDGDGTKLTGLAFDVPNFHDYHGSLIMRGSNSWRGRLTVEAGDWLIELDATDDLRSRIDALRSVGGYITTHAGSLKRKDGHSFSCADTSEIRHALSMWLSFCRGLWCSPIFWHCRSDGWTHYTLPRLSLWRGVRSWFPLLNCNRVPGTFVKLLERISDPTWKDSIELAIY